jgi:hypothetical protein
MELRPLLRAIATQRLAAYRSVELDGDAARDVLGERVWAFLTMDSLETARRDRAVDLADLSVTVERLERLNDIADD